MLYFLKNDFLVANVPQHGWQRINIKYLTHRTQSLMASTSQRAGFHVPYWCHIDPKKIDFSSESLGGISLHLFWASTSIIMEEEDQHMREHVWFVVNRVSWNVVVVPFFSWHIVPGQIKLRLLTNDNNSKMWNIG
jgi:hypothetical protein